MAENILSPKPLSHNEIAQLAEILEHNFQYHRQQQTLFRHEYTFNLKVAVGLAFTAVVVDGLYISNHRPDLNSFLEYFSTEAEQDSITPIALAAVKIIDTGTHVFRKQQSCPSYYNAFAKALKSIIQSGLLDSAEKMEESQRYIQRLLRSSIF